MGKRTRSNTAEVRREFAQQVKAATKDLPKRVIAEKLGISRQMLNLYLREKATPGGEVIKRACDEWQLTLSIKGFVFAGDAFSAEVKPSTAEDIVQPTLFDLLEKLQANQLEAIIVGRIGDSFHLELRIKSAA
jgi:transcriptional regulator with XRE-family HTH domain